MSNSQSSIALPAYFEKFNDLPELVSLVISNAEEKRNWKERIRSLSFFRFISPTFGREAIKALLSTGIINGEGGLNLVDFIDVGNKYPGLVSKLKALYVYGVKVMEGEFKVVVDLLTAGDVNKHEALKAEDEKTVNLVGVELVLTLPQARSIRYNRSITTMTLCRGSSMTGLPSRTIPEEPFAFVISLALDQSWPLAPKLFNNLKHLSFLAYDRVLGEYEQPITGPPFDGIQILLDASQRSLESVYFPFSMAPWNVRHHVEFGLYSFNFSRCLNLRSLTASGIILLNSIIPLSVTHFNLQKSVEPIRLKNTSIFGFTENLNFTKQAVLNLISIGFVSKPSRPITFTCLESDWTRWIGRHYIGTAGYDFVQGDECLAIEATILAIAEARWSFQFANVSAGEWTVEGHNSSGYLGNVRDIQSWYDELEDVEGVSSGAEENESEVDVEGEEGDTDEEEEEDEDEDSGEEEEEGEEEGL